jgi:hypothetical protein
MEQVRRNIQKLVKAGRVRFKKHAFIRMVERKIDVSEVEEALKSGLIIESYPDDKPLESFLFLGFTASDKALHVVVALDEKIVWVITVYEPNRNKWDKTLSKRVKR